MIRQNKDKNERFIIVIYTALGLYAQQMDKDDGFDLLVHGEVRDYDGNVICAGPWVVEAKSSKAKAQLKNLTSNEKKIKAAIELVRGKYNIAVTGFDAFAAINLRLDDLDNFQLWRLERALSDYLATDIDVDVLLMVQQFYNQVILEMTGDKTDG